MWTYNKEGQLIFHMEETFFPNGTPDPEGSHSGGGGTTDEFIARGYEPVTTASDGCDSSPQLRVRTLTSPELSWRSRRG